jgi:hypothetical protein
MVAAQQHGQTAIAVSRETGWNLDEYAAERDWTAVELGPVGQHRDSGALDRSNFDVIYADLRDKFGDAIDSPSFGHWGVGWIDEIAWDAGRDDVREQVESWAAALADYPVADETALCTLEHEEAIAHIEWTTRAYIERDDIEYELVTGRDGWAGEIFSYLFDVHSYCTADEIGEDDCTEAAFECGLYVPELPLVLLANVYPEG